MIRRSNEFMLTKYGFQIHIIGYRFSELYRPGRRQPALAIARLSTRNFHARDLILRRLY